MSIFLFYFLLPLVCGIICVCLWIKGSREAAIFTINPVSNKTLRS